MGIKNFFKNIFENLFNTKEEKIKENIEIPKKKKETKTKQETKTSKPKTKKSFGEKVKESLSKLKPKKEKEQKVKVPKAKKHKEKNIPEYNELVSQNISNIFTNIIGAFEKNSYYHFYYSKILEIQSFYEANKNKYDVTRVDFNYIDAKIEKLLAILYMMMIYGQTYSPDLCGVMTCIISEIMNGFDEKPDIQINEQLWYELDDIDF